MLTADRRPRPLDGALLATALGLGLAIYIAPLPALGAAVLLTLAATAVATPGLLDRVFLAGAATLLIGYAFLSKAFAYVGAAPLFIGEAVLGLGVLYFLLDRRDTPAVRSIIPWLWGAVAIWSAARTIPYLAVHGLDALRDGVIWGYGIFIILVASLVLRDGRWSAVPLLFGRLIPVYLVWAPIGMAMAIVWGSRAPVVPGSDVSVLTLKPGDVGVHFGGIAAFLLLGLGGTGRRAGGDAFRHTLTRGALWALWGGTMLVLAVASRAALLSALMSVAVVVLVSPGRLIRRLLAIGVAVFVIGAALVTFDVSIPIRSGRTISATHMVENVVSIFGGGSSAALQGTRGWRLAWWGEIVDYTVRGEHFWTGKGFGINLADSDGFQVSHDGSLRSPHNGHLTILARAGVPGLFLWTLLHTAFAAAMLRAHHAARRAGFDGLAKMHLWTLAYWAAFMTNATFDVFIEGPQGGIWLWCVMGYGVALTIVQRDAMARRAEVRL